MLLCQKQ